MEMNETLRERQQLAYERIRQIAADPEINGAVGDYFQKKMCIRDRDITGYAVKSLS